MLHSSSLWANIKRASSLLLLAFASVPTFAQAGAEFDPPFPDGFYRVRNVATNRYAYLSDNVGEANWNTMAYDMGAIVLYTPAYHDRFSDPAGVIYVENVYNWNIGHKNDLRAQNTGFYDIIGHFIQILPDSDANNYYIYESRFGKWLGDGVTGKFPTSYVEEVQKSAPTVAWDFIPFSPDGDEYLGIKPQPDMLLNGKYYKTYIVGFSMSFVSPGMKAYYLDSSFEDVLVLREITGRIPANTPIIVECSTPDASTNRVQFHYEDEAEPITNNRLTGQYFCYLKRNKLEYDAKTMRVLAVKDGHLAFVKASADDATHCTMLEFKNGYDVTYLQCISANSAYLKVPADYPDEVAVMTYEEYAASHPYEVYDINIDGKIDLQDLQCIKDMMLQKATKWTRADVNGDGRYSIGDVTSYVKFLMNRK